MTSSPFAEPLPFRVLFAAASHVGRVRSNNEDRVVVADFATGVALSGGAEGASRAARGGWVAAVCDGMGGEEGGEVASSMAVDAILGSMLASRGARDVAESVRGALDRASALIFAEARRIPRLSRMGTTATVAALGDGELVVGQVGDSRCYLLRRGALVQLTRDQTLVAMLAERTRQTYEELVAAHGSNVILQAVGTSPSVDVAMTRVPLLAGDVVLLCSDGLHGPVDDDRLRAILLAEPQPARACEALVSTANDRGGPDNVSCVVARFERV
ncbi:MAG TPA: protein phosphatase 2C domain-containing protein [Polyangiaceae bacterium]|jgi:protein phosphatase